MDDDLFLHCGKGGELIGTIGFMGIMGGGYRGDFFCPSEGGKE